MTIIYITCVLIVFLLVLFLVAAVIYSLYKAYLAMQSDMVLKGKILKLIALGFAFWLLITAVLSIGGYYTNFKYFPPRVLILGLLPPILLSIFLLFSKSFGKVLQRIPPAWLIKIQSFRIVMELMLWLAFMGDLIPFQMTFLGFNMDIIAGITALFAGAVFFRKGRFFKPEMVIWNVFGILLLINILFIAIISTPSVFRIFMNEPSSALMATFPFIWIPTFIVPFALSMHLFSLKQVFMKQLKPFNNE